MLEAFRDEEKRHSFYRFFNDLEDCYEILSPDPFLREFIEDYQRLADLYALLRSAYEAGRLTNRELARKTAYLVQEHTQVGVIREAIAVYEITPKTLEQISRSNQPDTVKVFNLLKSINEKVETGAETAPYLHSIGWHFQSGGGSMGAADWRRAERDSLAADETQMGELFQPRAIDF